MLKWKKPEIIVVDLKEYEKAILASARSGGGGCGCGGGMCGCSAPPSCYDDWN